MSIQERDDAIAATKPARPESDPHSPVPAARSEATEPIDAFFVEQAGRLSQDPGAELPPGLDATLALELFDSQLRSRHLDLAARWLRARNEGFYTIGSSGHESNAAVAAALRPSDPALLHYRSGGFYLQRAVQVPGHDGVRDVLLGLVGAASEPISGGRHKVFG